MAWTKAKPQMNAEMREAIEAVLLATENLRASDLPVPVVEAINTLARVYLRPGEWTA